MGRTWPYNLEPTLDSNIALKSISYAIQCHYRMTAVPGASWSWLGSHVVLSIILAHGNDGVEEVCKAESSGPCSDRFSET